MFLLSKSKKQKLQLLVPGPTPETLLTFSLMFQLAVASSNIGKITWAKLLANLSAKKKNFKIFILK
jgi:hypothetical protein